MAAWDDMPDSEEVIAEICEGYANRQCVQLVRSLLARDAEAVKEALVGFLLHVPCCLETFDAVEITY